MVDLMWGDGRLKTQVEAEDVHKQPQCLQLLELEVSASLLMFWDAC